MIKVANVTGVFPVFVLKNRLTWITWSAVRASLALTARASLSDTHTHTRIYILHWRKHALWLQALMHSHQCSDVIRVLIRDYSDITGTAAKLNLLASPCACGALQLEHWVCLCPCVLYKSLWKLCDPWVSASSYHPFIHISINVSIKKKKKSSQNTLFLWCP